MCVGIGMSTAGCNFQESCVDSVLEGCSAVCVSEPITCTDCMDACSSCVVNIFANSGCDSTKASCVNYAQNLCSFECSDPTCEECSSASPFECAIYGISGQELLDCQYGLCRQLCPGVATWMGECTQDLVAAGFPVDEWCVDYNDWLISYSDEYAAKSIMADTAN